MAVARQLVRLTLTGMARNRDVAVKILTAAHAGDPDSVRRFEKEARAVASLSHPNVVPLFDVGGTVTPDRFLVDKVMLDVVGTHIADKHVELTPDGMRDVEPEVEPLTGRRIRHALLHLPGRVVRDAELDVSRT